MSTANRGQDYQHWLAKINQLCGQFAARPLDDNFHGEIDASYTGDLKVSTVTARGINLYRTRQEIRRDNDAWFYTVFQLSGQATIEQDGRQAMLEIGDITLIDASRPCSIIWQQTSRQASLLLPRSLLEQQLLGSEISIATRLAKTLPMVQLSQRLLHHQEAQPTRRDKQFQKIMALIDESIQAEHLRPEWLASETGMSVRSLYRLFAEKGLVVAQYIKNRRLDLCARALESAHDDEKLAGIGYSWGFSDHSHFSTAFKQRFGVSPGEYRKRCR